MNYFFLKEIDWALLNNLKSTYKIERKLSDSVAEILSQEVIFQELKDSVKTQGLLLSLS